MFLYRSIFFLKQQLQFSEVNFNLMCLNYIFQPITGCMMYKLKKTKQNKTNKQKRHTVIPNKPSWFDFKYHRFSHLFRLRDVNVQQHVIHF